MAVVQVTGYRIGWDIDGNTGRVALRLQNGQAVNIPVNSAEVLAALAAILNESPVGYDEDQRRLLTGWEEIGGT